MSDETTEELQPTGIDEKEPEKEAKKVEPDEYAALKEDFSLVVKRGVDGFQEYAPGREIKHSIMRLQGRHGMLVETNDRGLISMPEKSGTVTDNQGKTKIQRMFIGLNCSSSTKATAFKSVNLLRQGETSVKEFEVNSASYDLLKKTIEESQSDGEDVQRKIDEDDYKHFERLTDESCETVSTNLNNEEEIRPGLIFSLVSLARQTLKKILGAKLDTSKIVFFNISDTCELADNQGGKADTVLSRTGFAIQAKTTKGNEVMRTIRGTGGMSALLRYRNQEETTPELEVKQLAEAVAKDAIDLDRAQTATILAGEAYVVLGPTVVGVLAHEVYGHTSEADIIVDNKHDKTSDLNLKQRIGGQVAVDAKFHMIDDGGCEIKLGDQVISNTYGGIILDDDGVPGKRTYLIKKGIMRNAMNSADTIGEIADGLPEDIKREMLEHGLTGNLRSERFDKEPMVRMTNTFILPDEDGPDTIAELASQIPGSKKGVYIASCNGGWVQPSTGDFQVTGQLGYLIENGIVTDKPVKDVVIRGNISKFGSKIKAIGSSKTIKHTFTGYCIEGDTPILTPHGLVAIKDIQIGDQVMTHRGRFRTVQKTFQRTANSGFRVRPTGGRSFIMTGNHEVLTQEARHVTRWWNDQPDYLKTKESKWTPTEELVPTAGNKANWRTYATMPVLTDKTAFSTQTATEQVGFRNSSLELFELIGWYLAEGSIWSVHSDILGIDFSDSASAQQAERIKELTETLGWKCYSYDRIRDNKRTYSVRIAEPGLAILWSDLFGQGAEEKKLPPNLYTADAENKKALLRGYWLGDGSCSMKRRQLTTATASPALVGGLMLLLGQLGIYPSYRIETAEQINARETTQFKANYDLHRLEIAGTQAEILRFILGYAPTKYGDMQHHIALEDKFLTRIESVELINQEINVYNLGVEGDNSYVTPGMALHNCGKDSQWVPVEAGGPALLVEDVTVGQTVPKWSWAEEYKEYSRQIEEVACGQRKRSEIYLRFLEDETPVEEEQEDKIQHDHSDICMVVGALDPADELRILMGREPFHSEFTMGEDGALLEEE